MYYRNAYKPIILAPDTMRMPQSAICQLRKQADWRFSKKESNKVLESAPTKTPTLCGVAHINSPVPKNLQVISSNPRILLRLLSDSLARTRWHKRLAVSSLRCCLSDGMINEARGRAHPSWTGEASAITGGISHTEPSEYRLSHRQQLRNAAEQGVDNPSKTQN